MERMLLARRQRIREALHKDFDKPPQEVDLIEIYPVLREIRHARRHLRQWMRPHHVPTPLAFIGSRSWIHYESKGVVLIMSPWNYPLNLTLSPLVSAIAAGCTAIVKPSELTPHASQLIADLVGEVFDPTEVAVVQGGVETGQALLALPFHHIFFTGSMRVGRIVMHAAAQHHASITLEMGGKCPAIIDRTANLQAAAQRIVQTKWANAGQTCVAPDYLLVHASRKDALLQVMSDEIRTQYPDLDNYPAMVNQEHFERVAGYLTEAQSEGIEIVCGGTADATSRRISPSVLDGTTATLASEEIFGPLLPVITYESLGEAIAYINDRPRPLGLYIYARDRRLEEQILAQTRAGGTCFNHSALNYYNNNLPFGGVNNSGFGKSHGFEGFKAFSNARGIYRQVWRRSPVQWLRRPFTRTKEALIDITLKWL